MNAYDVQFFFINIVEIRFYAFYEYDKNKNILSI